MSERGEVVAIVDCSADGAPITDKIPSSRLGSGKVGLVRQPDYLALREELDALITVVTPHIADLRRCAAAFNASNRFLSTAKELDLAADELQAAITKSEK